MIKELAVLASSAVIAVNSANYDNRFYNLSNPPEINMVQQSGSAKPDNKNKPPSLLEKSCSDLSIEKIKRVVPPNAVPAVFEHLHFYNGVIFVPHAGKMDVLTDIAATKIKGYDFHSGTPLSAQAYLSTDFARLDRVEMVDPVTNLQYGVMFKHMQKGRDKSSEKEVYLFSAEVPYRNAVIDIAGCSPKWDLDFFNYYLKRLNNARIHGNPNGIPGAVPPPKIPAPAPPKKAIAA